MEKYITGKISLVTGTLSCIFFLLVINKNDIIGYIHHITDFEVIIGLFISSFCIALTELVALFWMKKKKLFVLMGLALSIPGPYYIWDKVSGLSGFGSGFF